MKSKEREKNAFCGVLDLGELSNVTTSTLAFTGDFFGEFFGELFGDVPWARNGCAAAVRENWSRSCTCGRVGAAGIC